MAKLRTVRGPDACWVSGPFCFAVGCVRHWLVNLIFNRFNTLCFSRVRARVAASRMGLPLHVLYHGLFVCF